MRWMLKWHASWPRCKAAARRRQAAQRSVSYTHLDVYKRQIDGLRKLLTERQIDVMRLLSQGKPNKLIARDLGISEGLSLIHI